MAKNGISLINLIQKKPLEAMDRGASQNRRQRMIERLRTKRGIAQKERMKLISVAMCG